MRGLIWALAFLAPLPLAADPPQPAQAPDPRQVQAQLKARVDGWAGALDLSTQVGGTDAYDRDVQAYLGQLDRALPPERLAELRRRYADSGKEKECAQKDGKDLAEPKRKACGLRLFSAAVGALAFPAPGNGPAGESELRATAGVPDVNGAYKGQKMLPATTSVGAALAAARDPFGIAVIDSRSMGVNGYTVDYVGGGPLAPGQGHGNDTVAALARAAPAGAQLNMYRVVADGQRADPGVVADAIRDAAASGNRVILANVSGDPRANAEVTAAAAYAASRGALVVAPTGNNGSLVGTPAVAPGVIAVGSTDRLGRVSPFTNVAGADKPINLEVGEGVMGAGGPKTGTSMSAATAAGKVAEVLKRALAAHPYADPRWTADVVREAVNRTAVWFRGAGEVDQPAATAALADSRGLIAERDFARTLRGMEAARLSEVPWLEAPGLGLAQQAVVRNGATRVDADGAGNAWRSDPDGQPQTALRYRNGVSLNPTTDPYMVVPKGMQGVKKGDLSVAERDGRLSFGVVGDVGPREGQLVGKPKHPYQLGESSMKAVSELGLLDDPRRGGADDKKTRYYFYPGTAQRWENSQQYQDKARNLYYDQNHTP